MVPLVACDWAAAETAPVNNTAPNIPITRRNIYIPSLFPLKQRIIRRSAFSMLQPLGPAGPWLEPRQELLDNIAVPLHAFAKPFCKQG